MEWNNAIIRISKKKKLQKKSVRKCSSLMKGFWQLTICLKSSPSVGKYKISSN